MDERFGAAYARSVASDQTLPTLDGMTAEQALGSGRAPREVWVAVCEAMNVPEQDRWGRERTPGGHGAAPAQRRRSP